MKVTQINNSRLMPFLLLFVCIVLISMNTATTEAASTAHDKLSQATIPVTPIANDPDFCATHWLFDRYPTAAATLGMAHDELWVALHDDKSIADFALTMQIDLPVVIDAIVNAETVHIQGLVQQGCLSPTMADTKLATLVAEITTFVHDKTAPAFLMCRVGWPAYDELTAKLLDLNLMGLYRALKHGQSIISLAAARTLSRQHFIDLLVAEKLTIIQHLVDTHCVAAGDGALWNKLIPMEVTDFVDNGVDAEAMQYWSKLIEAQPQLFFLPLLMK